MAAVQYGTLSFWDRRYASSDAAGFDWLLAFDDLRPTLAPLLAPTDRILVAGCGNAPFSAALREAGYTNLVSYDLSSVAIEQQRRRHPDMEWEVADATRLPWRDASFDVVLDK